jgi:RNA polymerase sigma-70 factor, ECF subfamily
VFPLQSTPDWDWNQASKTLRAETRRVLGPGPAAEDAAQEALLRAWRAERRGLTVRDRQAWLRQIGRHESYRLLDRGFVRYEIAHENESVADALIPTGQDEAGQVLERLGVRQALAQLPPQDQELIRLRFEADLPHSEVAAHLGISEATAKVRLHRLRHRLRGLLDGDEEAERG